ncbi:MAG: helix-turn-helix domain-containing protein [Candidatus Omnitrophica bacterium]|nr:helix-turn-helix domain-containing protein [Candidatus Omnitrophota bacterium]
MSSGQYITVREAAQVLGVSEKKITDLIEAGKLQAYKIADQFLRLKRNEVMQMRSSGEVVSENVKHDYTYAERLKDFFYFNDFYIVSFVIIAVLLFFIFFS